MSNRSKAQILVVDDDPNVRESLGMLLLSAGYDVATADNGVSAVSHLNTAVPDLIVTDLNMPHMSGAELIAHVRDCYPSISIVAMSGEYQGDAVPAGIIADRFYPRGAAPAKSFNQNRELDRDASGPSKCSRDSHPTAAGLVVTKRKLCLELS